MTHTDMSDTGRGGGAGCETGRNSGPGAGPDSGRALADDAARLLDRLRKEPLPEDPHKAAALRDATRNIFVLVEETRTLAAEEARISGISRSGPQKRRALGRPFFLDSGEPEEDREEGAAVDLQAYRERVHRLAIAARRRA